MENVQNRLEKESLVKQRLVELCVRKLILQGKIEK